jgi:hypothetical protein
MAQNEWQQTTYLINDCRRILAEQAPMTIRQLFYRLVSGGFLDNNLSDYKRVSSVMTKARNDGRISFDLIVDRSRPEYRPNVFKDAARYGHVVSKSYRKDYWATQPQRCEVWTEKDAIIGSIENVTDELGVTVRVLRGFGSTTKKYDVAGLIQGGTKPMTVFYLGDHDPSGRSIEDNLYADITAYGAEFEVTRLAIHPQDIAAFKLPPLRVKETDSRAAGFRREYGEECVELDALPPDELRSRIRQAVTGLLDVAAWNRAVEVEKVELESIRAFVKQWPGSQGGDE